jgi:hypothetical protein
MSTFGRTALLTTSVRGRVVVLGKNIVMSKSRKIPVELSLQTETYTRWVPLSSSAVTFAGGVERILGLASFAIEPMEVKALLAL